MLVRECTDDDVHLLERHLPTGAAQVHTAHRATARTGRTTFLVAWDGAGSGAGSGARPLGSCVVVWSPDPGRRPPGRRVTPPAPEVAHLFVGAGHRGRGAGTALLHAAEQLVRARGGDRCSIGVEVGHDAAARLYERLGYVDTGELETDSYTWVDEAGGVHPVTEVSRRLVKLLR